MQEAIALSDATFRKADHTSMGDAFPLAFSTGLGQSYGAFEDTKLVAFMGLVPAVIRMGEAKLNVYSLGSVCTDPSYRGKGIASLLLEEIISHCDKAGASLLLVSGGRSLYTRRGCTPFGRFTRFQLRGDSTGRKALAQIPNGVSFREMAPSDWFQLHALAEARGSRFQQSIWDMAGLIEAEALASCRKERHQVLVAEENGALTAFVVVGVPYERESVKSAMAYEWAGDAEVTASLLSHAVERFRLSALNVSVPWHEKELLHALRDVPAKDERARGTVLVVSPEKLVQQAAPYLDSILPGASESLAFERVENEDAVRVSWNGSSEQFSLQEFADLLFDPTFDWSALRETPERSQASEHGFDEAAVAALSQLFPLPFPSDAGINYV